MMAWLLGVPRKSLLALVRAYRLLLSPSLGSACRFEPSCSLYAIESLERHGAAGGSYLTLRRLVRCQPWCDGGHDPVPSQIFGRAKAQPHSPSTKPLP